MMQISIAFIVLSVLSFAAFSDQASSVDTALHFDQSQSSLMSLDFNQDDELKPVSNDFSIIEVSYLSNNIGERWAALT